MIQHGSDKSMQTLLGSREGVSNSEKKPLENFKADLSIRYFRGPFDDFPGHQPIWKFFNDITGLDFNRLLKASKAPWRPCIHTVEVDEIPSYLSHKESHTHTVTVLMLHRDLSFKN